jgi:hypothetical protein
MAAKLSAWGHPSRRALRALLRMTAQINAARALQVLVDLAEMTTPFIPLN